MENLSSRAFSIWMRDKNNMRKGSKMTVEQRKRLSIAHLGYVPTDEHKKKISVTHKKRNIVQRLKDHQKIHGTWNKGKTGLGGYKWKKGAKTPEVLLARLSVEYFSWRFAVYQRDDFTCQFCRKRGGNLNADHIKSFTHYPELRYELSNGRTLCHECHKTTDTYGGKSRLKSQKTYA